MVIKIFDIWYSITPADWNEIKKYCKNYLNAPYPRGLVIIALLIFAADTIAGNLPSKILVLVLGTADF